MVSPTRRLHRDVALERLALVLLLILLSSSHVYLRTVLSLSSTQSPSSSRSRPSRNFKPRNSARTFDDRPTAVDDASSKSTSRGGSLKSQSLKPPSSVRPSSTHPKQRGSAVSPSTSTTRGTRDSSPTRQSFEVDLNVIKDVKAQLQYARNGHAVLRQLLVDTNTARNNGPRRLAFPFLSDLRDTLMSHGRIHELAAWRQKILVAVDDNPSKANELTMSCQTVEQCRVQYQKLVANGGGDKHDETMASLPFLQYFNTWRTIPAVYELIQQLAQPAALLMDVSSVRLYQDAVFWKRNHDGPTPWHVDARMAPFDTSHMITFWIPLQPVQRSGLVFCSKSHSDFALPYWNEQPTSAPSSNVRSSPWNNLEERYSTGRKDGSGGDGSIVDYMPLELGDATVHSGWTLHCANGGSKDDVATTGTTAATGQSKTSDSRLALAVTFVDARAPVRSDAIEAVKRIHRAQQQDSNHFAQLSIKADREDIWSYQDWVHQVPAMSSKWQHSLVPVLWPRSKRNQAA